VHQAIDIIALIVFVIAVTGLSRRYGFPAPLVLTVVGVVASYLPWVPDYELSPELVLVGFLPPLLYAAALNTSLIDFRRNLRPITLLSVGLVLVNVVAVGLVVDVLLPVETWAAFAIGAVVAPPDAVAATAIARRVGMPRRMVTILQGESLVNDATALVALRTATAAAATSVSLWEVGWDFVLTAAGGFVVGLLVALVTGKIRIHVRDEITDTAISLITPFIAYLIAEELHFSGVLAVVITGLILGHKRHLVQSASSRIFERTNWRTIEFLLENTVFLLIGLQVRDILEATDESGLTGAEIAWACLAVVLTVLIVRPLWVFPATYVPRWFPSIRARDPAPPWTYPAAISWAGMRGVVTLAAAFALPEDTAEREVLILIALFVVGATLLLQGATLPWVLRRLRLSGPDPAEDALQAANVQQKATRAGLARLEELAGPDDAPEILDRIRRRSKERSEAMWERLGGTEETPSQAYARLRIAMIDAERAELIRLRDEGVVPDDIMRQVITAIDIEETILDFGQTSWSTADREQDLVSPSLHVGCAHIQAVSRTPPPRTPDGCEECLRDATSWVHLRLCMDCGHVGCCDSSPHKHATAHFHETDHPVMRSFEPGEGWLWCFVDDSLG